MLQVRALWLGVLFAVLGGASSVLLSGEAQAQNLQGNSIKGMALASVCQDCHGVDSMGFNEGIPRLAGLETKYLTRQLIIFRTSAHAAKQSITLDSEDTGLRGMERRYAGMDGSVIDLSDQNIADLAEYFNKLSCTAGAKELVEAPKLVNRCAICHGKQGLSQKATIPSLAGQNAVYLRRQMRLFKAGTKQQQIAMGDADLYRVSRIMKAQAAKVSDDDIHALSNYYASLSCIK